MVFHSAAILNAAPPVNLLLAHAPTDSQSNKSAGLSRHHGWREIVQYYCAAIVPLPHIVAFFFGKDCARRGRAASRA